MSKIPFSVSARTAKLIGRENFANAEGAVIELVKNAYDADADTSIIIFDRRDSQNHGPSIYLIDNGRGMAQDVVVDKWMQIGTDDKVANFTSERGRIKTGAKGIGRFALDRLGGRARMLTIPKETNKGLIWSVNWKLFDVVGISINAVNAHMKGLKFFGLKSYLENKFADILPIQHVLSSVKLKTGTILKISILRDEWDEAELESLFDNLEVLVPPKEQPDFSIYLFDTTSPAKYGQLSTAYYDDFDYRVSAHYLADEKKSLNVEITRNELNIDKLATDFSDLFELEQMKRFPFRLSDFTNRTIRLNLTLDDLRGFSAVDTGLIDRVGEFTFTFYFLKETFARKDQERYPYRNFNSSTRNKWLDKFGGVKIFRDGFRVRPYGEKGNDWLGLGDRAAKSPQSAGQRIGDYRIRPNQISGTVGISRVKNAALNDKSGREGIQENDVFGVFKNVVIGIINLFEKDRNAVMFSLSELNKKRNKEAADREAAVAEAERIQREKEAREARTGGEGEGGEKDPASNPTATEELLASATLGYKQELHEKELEIRFLRNLASNGLIMASFAHELKSLQSRIIPRTMFLEKELKKYVKENSFKNVNKEDNPFYMLKLIRDEDTKLKHWLDYSLSSLKKSKRSRSAIVLAEYFREFVESWNNALKMRGVRISLKGTPSTSYSVTAFPVDLDTVFNNLLSNSLNSFVGQSKKEVNISWKVDGSRMRILFSDTGVGLAKEYRNQPEEIFNAFETSKRDRKGNVTGTGMGLYIAKSVVDEYEGGTIEVVDTEGGFTMAIELPVNYSVKKDSKNV
jgi:signal transduction histidine kinase